MPEKPESKRDDEAVRLFVERMAMTLASSGFPRMPARVLMTMMCADEDSLAAADLAQRLDVSPAAISGAVRYLVQVGILVREPVPGSRRDRYQLPDDVWYETSATQAAFLKPVADLSDEGVAALGGPETRSGARVADMRDFYLFMLDEMDGLLDRWRATRARGSR